MTDNYRFKAFISYSHSDRAVADKLMRDLEGYSLPRKLVDTLGMDNSRPHKIGRVFRDREELPAAEDLSTEVKKALAQSEYLIVLCSPMAAASRWVNREIIEFKKLTGERRVLSVILSGEPFASSKGNPTQECLPPALRFKLGKNGRLTKTPAEPLAADFRKIGDGRRNGFLKIVAGLMNVGLDALIERDLQRKMRRVMAVTAASVVAMIGMGLLTYEAVSARRAAEFHQSEAEGLIEFMLTDLKEKLEPVGRLDVLDSVGERAVNYYENQSALITTDDALGRQARAFHLLGEIDDTKGNFVEARSRFEAAFLATKALLAKDPNNPDRVFDHAQSAFWLGFADSKVGDHEKTETAYQTYMDLAKRLNQLEPSNPRSQEELAYAHSNLGILYLDTLSQPDNAIVMFEAASKAWRQLLDTSPPSRRRIIDTANGLGWLADSQFESGQFATAKASRELQIETFEEALALDVDDKDVLVRMQNAALGLALIDFMLSPPETAINNLKAAANIIDTVAASDPDNLKWLRQSMQHNLHLSEMLIDRCRHSEAEEFLAKAGVFFSEVRNLGRTFNGVERRMEMYAALLQARLFFANNPGNSGYRELERAVSQLEVAYENGTAKRFLGRLLISGYWEMTRATQQHQPSISRIYLEKVTSFSNNVAHPLGPKSQYFIATAHQELGNHEIASKMFDLLKKSGVTLTPFCNSSPSKRETN